MAKNIVFLVHGMGTHYAEGERDPSRGPWHAQAIRTLDEAWRTFPSLRSEARERWIEYVPIEYDSVFRSYANRIGEDAARLRSYLPQASALQEVFDVLQDAGAEEAGFFWANIMDVMDYRFGADHFRNVHVRIAKAIAAKANQAWAEHGTNVTFSVIAHSLGTATAHGALNRLGGGKIGRSAQFKRGGLFQLQAYVSVANVSRVLWSGARELYESTIVRPLTQTLGPGYVDRFLDVRHVADPIPAPKRFAPKGWGPAYRGLEVRHVRSVNLHDLCHYLAHPRVSGHILRAVVGGGDNLLPTSEIEAAAAAYPDVELTDRDKKQQVERLVADLARSLHEAYGSDQALLGSMPKLVARAVRDLFANREALRPLLEG
jgi:hypothetical protein